MLFLNTNLIIKKINKNEFLPFIFLSIVFLSNTQTTVRSLMLLTVMFVINYKTILNIFDKNFLLLVIFILFYYIISIIDEESKTAFAYSLFAMPVALYSGGKCLGLYVKDDNNLISYIFIISLLCGLPVIISVIQEIFNYGFFGNFRSLLYYNKVTLSATVAAGTLVPLVSFSSIIFTKTHLPKKIFIFFVYLLVILVALRLGSRTLILLGMISLFVGVFYNYNKQSLFKTFVVIIAVLIPIFLIYVKYSDKIDFTFYFLDRMNSDEFGVMTGGGRVVKWIESLNLIITNPFGWKISLNGYSHNLWLDVARNGGWISFIFSILIFISYFQNLKKYLNHSSNQIFKTLNLSITFCLVGLFCVEPIMDGFIYVFGFFCFFWGLLNSKCNYANDI